MGKFPTQRSREFLPPEQGIFRPSREFADLTLCRALIARFGEKFGGLPTFAFAGRNATIR
jgi:hypothetical protein